MKCVRRSLWPRRWAALSEQAGGTWDGPPQVPCPASTTVITNFCLLLLFLRSQACVSPSRCGLRSGISLLNSWTLAIWMKGELQTELDHERLCTFAPLLSSCCRDSLCSPPWGREAAPPAVRQSPLRPAGGLQPHSGTSKREELCLGIRPLAGAPQRPSDRSVCLCPAL